MIDHEKTATSPTESQLLEVVKDGMQEGKIICEEPIEDILLIDAVVPILKFRVGSIECDLSAGNKFIGNGGLRNTKYLKVLASEVDERFSQVISRRI